MAGPTGIEPATYGLRVRRSGLTELRARIFSLETVFVWAFRRFGFSFLWFLNKECQATNLNIAGQDFVFAWLV